MKNSNVNNTANHWVDQYMKNTYGFQYPNIINNQPSNNNNYNYKPYIQHSNKSDNNINIQKPNTKINSINDSSLDESQKLIEELLNEVDKYKNEVDKYKNENEQLKNKINQLENDNIKLNNDVKKANKIIAGLNEKQNEEQESQYIILSLNETIKDQEKKISELKTQLNTNVNANKSIKSFNFDDIIVIHFISMDQKINCALKCLKTDTFAEVEEKLYQKYDEYRESNNNFIANGKMILRFKKISDNEIHDGDKIQLINIEE